MLKGLWHWNESALPIERVIEIAQAVRANVVILKAGYHDPVYTGPMRPRPDFPRSARLCLDAGLLVAAEVYSLPHSAAEEGRILRAAIKDGLAQSVILNCEERWESLPLGTAMGAFQSFREQFRGVGAVHASTDFRGNRLSLPYHGELAKFVSGWMPMIYPRAFRPTKPVGYIQRAFDDVFGAWNRARNNLPQPGNEKPVRPVLQVYDRMDYQDVAAQVLLSQRWRTEGTSLYAAHDFNVRARWGAQDAWALWEEPEASGLSEGDKLRVAEAAAMGARNAAAVGARNAVMEALR